MEVTAGNGDNRVHNGESRNPVKPVSSALYRGGSGERLDAALLLNSSILAVVRDS